MSYYDFDVRTEPIMKMEVTSRLPLEAVIEHGQPEHRWPIQRALFDARMDLLKDMIASGQVACAPPKEYVQVVVQQKVIPGELTGGQNINLPECNTHYSYIMKDKIVW